MLNEKKRIKTVIRHGTPIPLGGKAPQREVPHGGGFESVEGMREALLLIVAPGAIRVVVSVNGLGGAEG